MKYLTKPTMVEAFEVISIYDTDDLPDWAKDLVEKKIIYQDYRHDCIRVGELSAYEGDYVLLDKRGDLHVCNQPLFKIIFRSDEENQ